MVYSVWQNEETGAWEMGEPEKLKLKANVNVRTSGYKLNSAARVAKHWNSPLIRVTGAKSRLISFKWSWRTL